MSATAVLVPHRSQVTWERVASRRVTVIWALLYFNVLGSATGGLLHLPHKGAQLLTQGALVAALILALSINRNAFVRSSWFLGLYTLLAVVTLMMSVRFVSLGTAYRGFRLLAFLVVLWLLTPWWRSQRMVLLRSHLLALSVTLATLLLSFLVSPSKAFSINYGTVRLQDVIWPIPTTKVAHFMAVFVGLLTVLLLCGYVKRAPALLGIALGSVALIATHTRTALAGLVAGLLVACVSLVLRRRRVRRAFGVVLIVMLAALPLSPFIKSWLTRGESSSAISTLSGRTKVWPLVLTEARPETNKILGSGMTNDSLINQYPAVDGLPIDSSWLATYQNQGVVGWVLEALMFLFLLLLACMRPRGPTSAMALFLVVYCLVSSFTQSGMGEASNYLLELTLAASLLVPRSSEAPLGTPSLP